MIETQKVIKPELIFDDIKYRRFVLMPKINKYLKKNKFKKSNDIVLHSDLIKLDENEIENAVVLMVNFINAIFKKQVIPNDNISFYVDLHKTYLLVPESRREIYELLKITRKKIKIEDYEIKLKSSEITTSYDDFFNKLVDLYFHIPKKYKNLPIETDYAINSSSTFFADLLNIVSLCTNTYQIDLSELHEMLIYKPTIIQDIQILLDKYSVFRQIKKIFKPHDLKIKNEKDVENQLIEPFLRLIGYNKTQFTKQLVRKIGRVERIISDYVFDYDNVKGNASWILEAKFSITKSARKKDFLQLESYGLLLKTNGIVLADKNGLEVTKFNLESRDFDELTKTYFSWEDLKIEKNFNLLFNTICNFRTKNNLFKIEHIYQICKKRSYDEIYNEFISY